MIAVQGYNIPTHYRYDTVGGIIMSTKVLVIPVMIKETLSTFDCINILIQFILFSSSYSEEVSLKTRHHGGNWFNSVKGQMLKKESEDIITESIVSSNTFWKSMT